MSALFLKIMNEYIIGSIIESSDKEYSSNIGHDDYSSQEGINSARSFIHSAIKEKRQERLTRTKELYAQSRNPKNSILDNLSSRKTIQGMFSQVVSVMQDKERVPEGLLVAFREQGQNGSEEDIRNIWKSLVELGLIDSEQDDHS